MSNIMTVLLKPIAEEAGGYSELPTNLLQKFHQLKCSFAQQTQATSANKAVNNLWARMCLINQPVELYEL